MRLPELTQKRRDMLATFCLNVVVVSIAVAVFEGNWRGLPAMVVFLCGFLIFAKELDV